MVKSMVQEVKATNQNASDGISIKVYLNTDTRQQTTKGTEISTTESIEAKHTYKVKMVCTSNRINEIWVNKVK